VIFLKILDMLKCDSQKIRVRDAVRTGEDMVVLKDARPRSIARIAVMLICGLLIFLAAWFIVAEVYNTYLMYSLRFPPPLQFLKD